MKWYSADHHINHSKILQYEPKRLVLGSTVEEMNEALIARWNTVVKKNDEVYHLGDFAFTNDVEPILRRLNGKIHLIHGNHDSKNTIKSACWETSRPYAVIKDSGEVVVLFHYSIRQWYNRHHKSFHCYGHAHGSLPGIGRSLDVGVDCWDYYPVTLEQIKERLTETGEIDNYGFHHDRNDDQAER